MTDRLADLILVLAIALTAWQAVLVAIVVGQGVEKSLLPGVAAVALWCVWVLVRP